jgi:hypothetical protein
MEPPGEHQKVVRQLVCYEFPFDCTRTLEFALFRTFCMPSISRLLDYTGEFAQRAQKRYDDTDLLVSEIMEHGYDNERGRAAVERINALHGHFRISNGNFLYVLSSFIYGPIRLARTLRLGDLCVSTSGWRCFISGTRWGSA